MAIIDDPATPVENGENTSQESVSLIDAMLDKHGEKIAGTDSATPRYRITIADDTLGKTTFIFEKSDRRQAIVRLKRGNLAVIMDEQNGTIQLILILPTRTLSLPTSSCRDCSTGPGQRLRNTVKPSGPSPCPAPATLIF
ncbi:MAG: hypothetical protein R2874_01875 [Desulfobacterales bacterium]